MLPTFAQLTLMIIFLMEIVPCIAISYVLLTFDYIALYICCERDDHWCNLIMAHNTLNLCLLLGCTWVGSYSPIDKCCHSWVELYY
jgi:hypothetical protein